MVKLSKNKKGFTLVELIVSVAVFTVVMTISMGSILGVFEANRRSQSLRTGLDNLNLTLESMTRTIRFGTTYHCDVSAGTYTSPLDCLDTNNGANSLAVYSGGATVQWRYTANCYGTYGCIERNNGSGWLKLTSADINITKLTFFVAGADPFSTANNAYQPRVVIVVQGTAGTKTTNQSPFKLQTTVSQRNIDS